MRQIKKIAFLLSMLTALVHPSLQSEECGYPCIAEPVPSCCNLLVYADFLYWQATVDGLPFAAIATPSGFDFTSSLAMQRIDFDYRPGFRVGVGYRFDCDWDAVAEWTREHTFASRSLSAEPGSQLLSVWDIDPFGDLIFDTIRGHQKLNFDQFNLSFIKHVALGSSFIFHPFFGATGVWIDQRLNIESSSSTGVSQIRLRNDFSGGGLLFGVGTDYTPCSWLSLYGKGSYSLLCGKFNLKRKNTRSNVIGDRIDPETQRSVVGGWDLIAGLKGHYCCCGMDWTAHISYEFMLWPSQLRIGKNFGGGFTNVADSIVQGLGDIGFQGLTTGLAVQF